MLKGVQWNVPLPWIHTYNNSLKTVENRTFRYFLRLKKPEPIDDQNKTACWFKKPLQLVVVVVACYIGINYIFELEFQVSRLCVILLEEHVLVSKGAAKIWHNPLSKSCLTSWNFPLCRSESCIERVRIPALPSIIFRESALVFYLKDFFKKWTTFFEKFIFYFWQAYSILPYTINLQWSALIRDEMNLLRKISFCTNFLCSLINSANIYLSVIKMFTLDSAFKSWETKPQVNRLGKISHNPYFYSGNTRFRNK